MTYRGYEITVNYDSTSEMHTASGSKVVGKKRTTIYGRAMSTEGGAISDLQDKIDTALK